MREIKFRAWNKKLNKWVHFEFHWVFNEKKGDLKFIPQLKPSFPSEYDEKDIEIMQFTGLKDKDGKEKRTCREEGGDDEYFK